MSHVFKQALKTLGIEHRVSSAYHPLSQEALECWQQTFKSVHGNYCLEVGGSSWDGMHFFALREAFQESLGFNPNEFVFCLTIQGPLQVLKKQIMSPEKFTKSTNILKYVSRFRECLHKACSLAQATQASSQSTMKVYYDRRAVP